MATIIKNGSDFRVQSYLYPNNRVIVFDVNRNTVVAEITYNDLFDYATFIFERSTILRTLFGNNDAYEITNYGFNNIRQYLLDRFISLYENTSAGALGSLSAANYTPALFVDMFIDMDNIPATITERLNRQLAAGIQYMFHEDINVALRTINSYIVDSENYLTFNGEVLVDPLRHATVMQIGRSTTISGSISSEDTDYEEDLFEEPVPTTPQPTSIDGDLYSRWASTRNAVINTVTASDEMVEVRNSDRITTLEEYFGNSESSNIISTSTSRGYVVHSPYDGVSSRRNKKQIKNESMKFYPDRELLKTCPKGTKDYYLPSGNFIVGLPNNQSHIFFENLVFDKENKINYDKINTKDNIKFSNFAFKKVFLDIDTKSILFFENIPKDVEISETPDGVFYNSKYTEKDVAECFIIAFGRKQFHNYIESTPKKVDHKYIQNFTKDKKGKIKYGEDSTTFLITEGKRYSFGIEMEVYDGYLPDYFFKEFNLTHTYDGSIKNDKGQKCGREFVTGVLKGDSGIFHLQKICNELARRTRVNKTCGFHAHLGGFEFSDDFVVYSWLLCKKIEKELQSYLPKSRRNNEYCHDLPDNKTVFGKSFPLIEKLKTCSNKYEYDITIECLYKELFKAYAQVYPGKDVNKLTNHPQGNNVGYNHSSLRYSWINFLPCMFNVRDVREFTNEEEREKYLNGDKSAGKITSYSWELRSHNGTTNFTKVKNWLLLFMGITYYIENNKKAIINNDKISINDILKYAYPKKSAKLIEYFHKRQELFKDDAKESSEYAVQAKRGIKQQQIKQLI